MTGVGGKARSLSSLPTRVKEEWFPTCLVLWSVKGGRGSERSIFPFSLLGSSLQNTLWALPAATPSVSQLTGLGVVAGLSHPSYGGEGAALLEVDRSIGRSRAPDLALQKSFIRVQEFSDASQCPRL